MLWEDNKHVILMGGHVNTTILIEKVELFSSLLIVPDFIFSLSFKPSAMRKFILNTLKVTVQSYDEIEILRKTISAVPSLFEVAESGYDQFLGASVLLMFPTVYIPFSECRETSIFLLRERISILKGVYERK